MFRQVWSYCDFIAYFEFYVAHRGFLFSSDTIGSLEIFQSPSRTQPQPKCKCTLYAPQSTPMNPGTNGRFAKQQEE